MKWPVRSLEVHLGIRERLAYGPFSSKSPSILPALSDLYSSLLIIVFSTVLGTPVASQLYTVVAHHMYWVSFRRLCTSWHPHHHNTQDCWTPEAIVLVDGEQGISIFEFNLFTIFIFMTFSFCMSGRVYPNGPTLINLHSFSLPYENMYLTHRVTQPVHGKPTVLHFTRYAPDGSRTASANPPSQMLSQNLSILARWCANISSSCCPRMSMALVVLLGS